MTSAATGSSGRIRRSAKEIQTPAGLARAHLVRPASPRGSVVLGHGAGGSSWTVDLEALTALSAHGWLVVLVEQPWRVAGRKVATPPAQLDVGWLAVLGSLTAGRAALPRPLIAGGRSAGARVACRTAAAVGADAVLALSFPLHPPGKPGRSRAAEAQQVTAAGTPLAVIQGQRDPFGTPQEVREALGAEAEVFSAHGTHSFTASAQDVLDAARLWLDRLERDLAGSRSG